MIRTRKLLNPLNRCILVSYGSSVLTPKPTWGVAKEDFQCSLQFTQYSFHSGMSESFSIEETALYCIPHSLPTVAKTSK